MTRLGESLTVHLIEESVELTRSIACTKRVHRRGSAWRHCDWFRKAQAQRIRFKLVLQPTQQSMSDAPGGGRSQTYPGGAALVFPRELDLTRNMRRAATEISAMIPRHSYFLVSHSNLVQDNEVQLGCGRQSKLLASEKALAQQQIDRKAQERDILALKTQ